MGECLLCFSFYLYLERMEVILRKKFQVGMLVEDEDANMLPVYYIFPVNSTWCFISNINEWMSHN